RSGSMGGEPIEQARQAAIAAIRQLHPDDRVSVVSFANDARVDVPSTLVSDPQRLIRVVEDLRASGGTFLEGGWRSGAEQVAEHLDPGALNRIILLSDGQATHGVKDARVMPPIVAGLTAAGISTTAMGFGSQYNETLMLAIAEAGDGNYLHVEDAGLLPTIFEQELQGLTRTTGRRVSLGLEPNSKEGVEVAEVLTVLRTTTTGRLALPNLQDGQPVDVLVRLRVTRPLSAGALQGVMRARLAWDGPTGERGSRREQLDLPVLTGEAFSGLRLHPLVEEAEALQSIARHKRQAVAELDRGDRPAARASMARAADAGAPLFASSPAVADAVKETKVLETLFDTGDDRLARKRAMVQAYEASTSKKPRS
ncbi:MAG: VWA domain-containing protein, partial [Dermatophilaceae bacterium]|nr:VWA domain-containing protein [Dermatophilaceae bacterium]